MITARTFQSVHLDAVVFQSRVHVLSRYPFPASVLCVQDAVLYYLLQKLLQSHHNNACVRVVSLQTSEDVMKPKETRKSSCVNARGIPTAPYQVLHLLPEDGYPPPSGTPTARSDGGYPTFGTPQLGTPWSGTPHQVPLGQVRWGVPNLGYPRQVSPQPGLTGGSQPQVPPLGTPSQI